MDRDMIIDHLNSLLRLSNLRRCEVSDVINGRVVRCQDERFCVEQTGGFWGRLEQVLRFI